MAKVKVAVYGTVGKSVSIDTGLEPRVAALEAAIAALARGSSATRHSALAGLQIGDDHPQYTMWQARENITAQWTFQRPVWGPIGTETDPGHSFFDKPGSGMFANSVSGDPFFADVSLLLNCDGSNGSTAFPNLAGSGVTVTSTSGASVTTTNPKFGTGALNLNSAGYLRTTVTSSDAMDIFSGGDFTLEGWARVTTLGSTAGIFGYGDSGSTNLFRLYVDGTGVVNVQTSSGSGITGNTTPVSANTWFHWAVVRSGSQGMLYVNGVRQPLNTANWTGTFNSPTLFFLGACVILGGPTFLFTGAIDEVRITKGVARYTGTSFTPPDAPYDTVAASEYVALTVEEEEKIRFDSLGRIGLEGANYGTLRQSLLSGGSGAASWQTLVHTDISDFDEAAQDAVGSILVDSGRIDFTYNDATPSITADIVNSSVTYAKIQNVSATSRVLGRISSGAGVIEELTGANLMTILSAAGLGPANPSASVGLSAVNGSATSYMRSDAAPAIDQAIAPTWTGLHTFSRAGGTAIVVSTDNPRVADFDSTAANGPFVTMLRSGVAFGDFGNAATLFSGGDLDGIGFCTRGTDSLEFGTSSTRRWVGSDEGHWRVVNGALALADGITAPSTLGGFALIYVDTADGDLKVKFGDGTVKTIVTDT